MKHEHMLPLQSSIILYSRLAIFKNRKKILFFIHCVIREETIVSVGQVPTCTRVPQAAFQPPEAPQSSDCTAHYAPMPGRSLENLSH